MIYNISHLFMLFMLASIIGYILEIVFCTLGTGKIVINRGFLMGPYIPIYGIGTVMGYYLLEKYYSDPIALFCIALILSSILEYITSYLMEKIFKVRWWDYSKQPFNYNGRICLKNSILFGFLGLVVVYILFPFLSAILDVFSPLILVIISIPFFISFIVDLVFTTTTLYEIRTNLTSIQDKDITRTAHYEVMKKLNKYNFRFNRLLQAFPGNENVNIKEFKELKQIVLEYRKRKKKDKCKKVSTSKN